MSKPSNLLVKQSRHLFDDQEQREKFINALITPQVYHPCIWCRPKPLLIPFSTIPRTTWQPTFVERLAQDEKPGQTSLHKEGYFYCLDFSSVFAASVLLAVSEQVDLVLDVCAAPGGKSIFAWNALNPQLLLSNEVIGKRTGMLIANLKRCQISPSVVLSLDSQVLGQLIPHCIQVVIVDAPCSGQSLLAKGKKADGCFHPVNINKNANRQKRILANSAQTVSPQGYLAYMTCTYSSEENEGVSEWFFKKFPYFQPLIIPYLSNYQSHLTSLPCYRIWPQSNLGAGAFTILFKNMEEGKENSLPSRFLENPKFTLIE
mgnify:CR=1 FL=1